jgi:hypothetical protein
MIPAVMKAGTRRVAIPGETSHAALLSGERREGLKGAGDGHRRLLDSRLHSRVSPNVRGCTAPGSYSLERQTGSCYKTCGSTRM